MTFVKCGGTFKSCSLWLFLFLCQNCNCDFFIWRCDSSAIFRLLCM